MNEQRIKLGSATQLSVSPRAVARLLVEEQAAACSLRLSIGVGAGVQLLIPRLPAVGEYTVEVGAQARCTISILGRLTGEHQVAFTVNLMGEQAQVHVELAAVGEEASQASLTVTLNHTAPRTTGRITARRIQRARSVGSLLGRLLIGKTAHGTDTYLSDKALLLGAQAQAKSEPQLEILADDVKASHGASIGQLSRGELFYLKSRGLDQLEAEGLLLSAFLKPALVGVPLDLSNSLLHDVPSRVIA